MPTYKMTWIFNWGRSGWSESWYLDATDITTALLAATGTLAGTRKGLLGKGALLETAVVSDVAIDGDSLTQEIPPGGDFKPADPPSDTAWNAIYCRCDAGARARRQLWLRGVPDDWIVVDPVTKKNQPNAQLTGAFGLFRTAATGGVTALKVKTYDRAGAGTSGLPVTALAEDATGYTKMTVAAFTGVVGERVGSKKWKGKDAKRLNRTYNVMKVTPADIVIDLPWNLLTDAGSNFGGRVYPRRVIYADINRMMITRLARRKTGRAFFVAPGRQRVKRP